MTISKAEAQALATFVQRARPGWDHAGIVAAVMRASSLGSPLAIGAALCRLAENPDLRTPAVLAEPGGHWSGTTVATRKPPTMCGVHPTERALNCRLCEQEATTPPEGWRDRRWAWCETCRGIGYDDCPTCRGEAWIEVAP